MKDEKLSHTDTDSTSQLAISTQSDFVTALVSSPTPACVEDSLQKIYKSLPIEAQQNLDVIQLGWQFDPKTSQSRSFVTLHSKNHNEGL